VLSALAGRLSSSGPRMGSCPVPPVPGTGRPTSRLWGAGDLDYGRPQTRELDSRFSTRQSARPKRLRADSHVADGGVDRPCGRRWASHGPPAPMRDQIVVPSVRRNRMRLVELDEGDQPLGGRRPCPNSPGQIAVSSTVAGSGCAAGQFGVDAGDGIGVRSSCQREPDEQLWRSTGGVPGR